MILGISTPTKLPIVLKGTIEFEEIKFELIGQYIGSMILFLVCVLLFAFFYSLYRRLSKRKTTTFDKEKIYGPFVLYLRSFVDDKKTQKRISYLTDIRTEEELLVDVLSDIAPVYAIGDPKDKQMPLGASRIYVENEHWKSTVEDLAKKAEVVVLRLGKTDSFWWEVEMAIKNIPLEKVLFVVPESNSFSNVATLYKVLLENGIDITTMDISVERKGRGSISTLLFFEDGKPMTKAVKMSRFTQLFLSYENILRNTLAEFKAKYGLKMEHKWTLRWSALLECVFIATIFVLGVMKMVQDQTALKKQTAYELAEACVNQPAFVTKYSNEINDTTLYFGIVESNRGICSLNDDKCKQLFLIEAQTLKSMSRSEFSHIGDSPNNLLLMVKKYVPNQYHSYVKILAETVALSLQHSDEISEIIQQYKEKNVFLPQWYTVFLDSNKEVRDEYEYNVRLYDNIIEHIDDVDITDVIKYCQIVL